MNAPPQPSVPHARGVYALNRQLVGAVGLAMLGAMLVAEIGAIAPTAAAINTARGAYNRISLIGFWFMATAGTATVFLAGRRHTAE